MANNKNDWGSIFSAPTKQAIPDPVKVKDPYSQDWSSVFPAKPKEDESIFPRFSQFVEGSKDVARTLAAGTSALTDPRSMEPKAPVQIGGKLAMIRQRAQAYRAESETPAMKAGRESAIEAIPSIHEVSSDIALSKALEADPALLMDQTFIEKVIRTTPQVIGQAVISVATAGTLSLPFMGLQIVGGAYEQSIAEGATHENARNMAVLSALLQTPLEQIGIGFATKLIPVKKEIFKKLIGIAAAGFTEGLTEFIQEYPGAWTNLMATNPNENALKQLLEVVKDPETFKNALEAGTIGAVLGAGVKVVMPSKKAIDDDLDDDNPLGANPEITANKPVTDKVDARDLYNEVVERMASEEAAAAEGVISEQPVDPRAEPTPMATIDETAGGFQGVSEVADLIADQKLDVVEEVEAVDVKESILKRVDAGELDTMKGLDEYTREYLAKPEGRPEWAVKTEAVEPTTDAEVMHTNVLKSEAETAYRIGLGHDVTAESSPVKDYREYANKKFNASEFYGKDFMRQMKKSKLDPIQTVFSEIVEKLYKRPVFYVEYNEKVMDDPTSPLHSMRGARMPVTGAVMILKGDNIRNTGTLFHELTHDMNKLAPELWKTIASFVRSNSDPASLAKQLDIVKRDYAGADPNSEMDEIVAAFIGDIMMKKEAQLSLLKKLKKQEPSAFKKLMTFLRQALQKLSNAVRSIDTRESRILSKDIDAAVEFVTDALAEYQTKAKVTHTVKGQTVTDLKKVTPEFDIEKIEKKDKIWFSKMNSFMQDALPGKGGAKQLVQLFKSWKSKGKFKTEELEWSGLIEWIESPEARLEFKKAGYNQELSREFDKINQTIGDKKRISDIYEEINSLKTSDVITKKDIMDYLKENEVSIAEIKKSEKITKDYVDIPQLHEEKQKAMDLLDKAGYSIVYTPDITEAGRIRIESIRIYDSGRFIDYPVGPRDMAEITDEALDTVDYIESIDNDIYEQSFAEPGTGVAQYGSDNLNIGGGSEYAEILITLPKITPAFKSGHWKKEENVVAFVRYDFRVVDGKKVLLIQEIQSDWHQMGAKRGYGAGERYALARRYDDLLEQGEAAGVAVNTRWIRDNLDIATGLQRQILETYDAQDAAPGSAYDAGVADAPFKKTWSDLAMKRMVKLAAEAEVDYLAWVPGEVIQDRYDLTKYINSVTYSREDSTLYAYNKNDSEVLDEAIADPAEFDEFLGPEIGQRLRDKLSQSEYDDAQNEVSYDEEEGGWVIYNANGDVWYDAGGDLIVHDSESDAHEEIGFMAKEQEARDPQVQLTGLDLETGGEWAEHLYDEKLVNRTNDLFGKKKWGKPKVFKGDVPTSDYAIDDEVLVDGEIAFGGEVMDLGPEQFAKNRFVKELLLNNREKDLQTILDDTRSREVAGPRVAYAIEWLEGAINYEAEVTYPKVKRSVWMLPITQKMKDKIPGELIPKFDIESLPAKGSGDKAALSMINNIGRGINVVNIESDDYGTQAIAESLGFKKEGNQYKFDERIPKDVDIIAGMYQASWNIDLKSNRSAKNVLGQIAKQFGKIKGKPLDTAEQGKREKQLKKYLNKSWSSYRVADESTDKGELNSTKNVLVRPSGIESGKGRQLMVQVTSNYASEESSSLGDSYFDTLYANREGYFRPSDFWELPEWMGRVAKFAKDADVYVVRNIEEAKQFLAQSGYDRVLFSAMDN